MFSVRANFLAEEIRNFFLYIFLVYVIFFLFWENILIYYWLENIFLKCSAHSNTLGKCKRLNLMKAGNQFKSVALFGAKQFTNVWEKIKTYQENDIGPWRVPYAFGVKLLTRQLRQASYLSSASFSRCHCRKLHFDLLWKTDKAYSFEKFHFWLKSVSKVLSPRL